MIPKDILLRDMWNLELHKNPDFVEDTADQAKQEMKMENTLKKLQKDRDFGDVFFFFFKALFLRMFVWPKNKNCLTWWFWTVSIFVVFWYFLLMFLTI